MIKTQIHVIMYIFGLILRQNMTLFYIKVAVIIVVKSSVSERHQGKYLLFLVTLLSHSSITGSGGPSLRVAKHICTYILKEGPSKEII